MIKSYNLDATVLVFSSFIIAKNVNKADNITMYPVPLLIRQTALFLREILFPGYCLICGDSLLFRSSLEYPLCRICLRKVVEARRLQTPKCRICSSPLISETETCTRCRNHIFHFEENKSLFLYKGISKELIFQYKFNNKRILGKLFARFLAKIIIKEFPGYTIIPVPSSFIGKKRRRWDQMKLIIKYLQQDHHLPAQILLKREKGTAQKGLNLTQRAENIKGKVFCREKIKEDFILLIDDIFTTGGTTDECARVLKEAGAKKVSVFTIAQD